MVVVDQEDEATTEALEGTPRCARELAFIDGCDSVADTFLGSEGAQISEGAKR